MNSLGFDTLNAIDLFSNDNVDNTNSPVIIHIPHSSTYIPIVDGYVSDVLTRIEIQKLTDLFTSLFNVDKITKLVTPFSRLFCDVERLEDENEPMFKKGQGFYYTHTINGDVLRKENPLLKELIYKSYYLKHHEILTTLVENKLALFGKAIIIDCHTFNGKLHQDNSNTMPEICIGTNSYHTTTKLIVEVETVFNEYKIGINYPFSNTIVPQKFLNNNPNVQSIMIEINQNMCNINDIKRMIDINGKFKKLVQSLK